MQSNLLSLVSDNFVKLTCLDHCLDSLRQEIMCMADVTPMKFHHNLGDDFHIFPDIYATHTCKDFDAVRNWAAERQVEMWKLGF